MLLLGAYQLPLPEQGSGGRGHWTLGSKQLPGSFPPCPSNARNAPDVAASPFEVHAHPSPSNYMADDLSLLPHQGSQGNGSQGCSTRPFSPARSSQQRDSGGDSTYGGWLGSLSFFGHPQQDRKALLLHHCRDVQYCILLNMCEQ